MVSMTALAGALGLSCAKWSALWPITSCPTNFVTKLNLSSLNGFDAETCCEATCAAYSSCPEGYILVAHAEHHIGSDSAACCQAVHRFFFSGLQFLSVGLLSFSGFIIYKYLAKDAGLPKKSSSANLDKPERNGTNGRINKFRKSVTWHQSVDDVSEITKYSPSDVHIGETGVTSFDSLNSITSVSSMSSSEEIEGLSFKEAKKVRARRIPSNDDFEVRASTATTPSDSTQEVDFEASEVGEWYDIWTQRSHKDSKRISRSESENKVLQLAKEEAEQRKRQRDYAKQVVDMHDEFNWFNNNRVRGGATGRQNRARTAICVTADKQASMAATLSAVNLHTLNELDESDEDESQGEILDATAEFQDCEKNAMEWFEAHPADTRVVMVFSKTDQRWYKNSAESLSDFRPILEE